MHIVTNIKSLIELLIQLYKTGVEITEDGVKNSIFSNIIVVVNRSGFDEKTINTIASTVIGATKTEECLDVDIKRGKMNYIPYTSSIYDVDFRTGPMTVEFSKKINKSILTKQYLHTNIIWYDVKNELFDLPTDTYIQKIRLDDFKKNKLINKDVYLYNTRTFLLQECYKELKIKKYNTGTHADINNHIHDIYTENKTNSHSTCDSCGIKLFEYVYIYSNLQICSMCYLTLPVPVLKYNSVFLENHTNKLSDIIDEKSELYDLILSFNKSKILKASNGFIYVSSDKYIGIKHTNIIDYLFDNMSIPIEITSGKKLVLLDISL